MAAAAAAAGGASSSASTAAAIQGGFSTAGGLFGSMISGTFNRKAQKRQQQFIREMMAYDKPINQMKRYKEAGLNPYLMMSGQQAVSSGQAATTDTMDYSSVGEQIGNAFSKGAQALMAKKQFQQMDATTRKTNAEATEAESNARYADEMARLNRNKLAFDVEQTLPANLQQMQASIAESQGRATLYGNQSDLARQLFDFNEQNNKHLLNQSAKQLEVMDASINRMKIETAIREKELPWVEKKIRAEIGNLIANANAQNALADLHKIDRTLKDYDDEDIKRYREAYIRNMETGSYKSLWQVAGGAVDDLLGWLTNRGNSSSKFVKLFKNLGINPVLNGLYEKLQELPRDR